MASILILFLMAMKKNPDLYTGTMLKYSVVGLEPCQAIDGTTIVMVKWTRKFLMEKIMTEMER